MKKNIYKSLSNAKEKLFAFVFAVMAITANSQNTYTFAYTGGQQTMALQAGTYTIQTWGANGGDNLGNGSSSFLQYGGKGGYSVGVYTITSPTTVYINAGGIGGNSTASLNIIVPGGYNGGGYGSANATSGKSSGASGGGASHVATASGTLGALASNTSAVLIVAGGGGGAGESNYVSTNTQYNANGGNGGGLSGLQVVSTGYQGRHGQGGTQTAGGTGGDNASALFGLPLQGIFGAGGYNTLVNNTSSAGGSGIGGGGGGWYGGGAGWGGSTGFNSGAGGGGSGYIGGVNNGTTVAFGGTGYVANPDITGNGRVHIIELCSISIYASGSNSLNPAICSGQSLTLTTNAVSNFSWSTGQTTSSIVVAPTTNTVYSLVATASINCSTGTIRNVSVNSIAPVLSITNPSANLCLGQTTTLTASGALSYTWTNSGVVNGQAFTPASTQVYTVTGQNGCGTSTGTTSIAVAPLAVSVLATPTLVCQGYASTLTAVSAAGNYTWQPGPIVGSTVAVAPLANTVYTVTASDGTCAGTQTLLLTTKTTPTIATSQTLTSICMGQSVTLNASGAGAGGTYSWTPGGAGSSIVLAPSTSTSVLVAGTNSLNCTSTAQQIILVGLPPSLNVSTNKPVVCAGDPALLLAGSPMIQWTNGPATSTYIVNPNVTTVYTVTGSHNTNTCTAVATITITAIVANVTLTSSVSVCDGGTVSLVASGATSYKWNGGINTTNGTFIATPTSSSIFTLVATTSSSNVNCLSTHYSTVTVNPNPTVTVTPGKQTICRGETHTLTASGAATYSWSAPVSSSGTVVTVKPNTTTIYNVTGIDANGCQSTILYSAKVNSCLGINENNLQSTLRIYPNPNNGQFFVSSETEITLNLINTLGQTIRTIELNNNNQFKIEVSGLAKGLYYLSSGIAESQSGYKLIVE